MGGFCLLVELHREGSAPVMAKTRQTGDEQNWTNPGEFGLTKQTGRNGQNCAKLGKKGQKRAFSDKKRGKTGQKRAKIWQKRAKNGQKRAKTGKKRAINGRTKPNPGKTGQSRKFRQNLVRVWSSLVCAQPAKQACLLFTMTAWGHGGDYLYAAMYRRTMLPQLPISY